MRDACVLMAEIGRSQGSMGEEKAAARVSLTEDQDEQLCDILSRWHHWQLAARVGRGHIGHSLVFGELYRPSRQYDDWNGNLDTELENRRSAAVDFEVSEMLDPWKAAIYCLARNLYTGRTVWVSPRLPEDVETRTAIVVSARKQLTARLVSAGVM